MNIARDRSTRAAETKSEDVLPVYQWLGIDTPSSESDQEPEGEDDTAARSTRR